MKTNQVRSSLVHVRAHVHEPYHPNKIDYKVIPLWKTNSKMGPGVGAVYQLQFYVYFVIHNIYTLYISTYIEPHNTHNTRALADHVHNYC